MHLRRFFWFMLVNLLFSWNGTAAAQEAQLRWTFEPVGSGIKPALTLDSQGVAHIAFVIEAMDGIIGYTSNESGGWITENIANGYFYGPVDITLNPVTDSPVVAYHDHQDANFNPALGDEVVALREGHDWRLVTVSHPGHDGWDNSIVVDSGGFWHTASIDPAQFGSTDGVEYATNAYGAEILVEQIGSGPQPYAFATSIAIREDGAVGISYFDSNELDLVYAQRTPGRAGRWTLAVVDSEGDAGRFPSLAFDSAGVPHIVYYHGDSGAVSHAWRGVDNSWQTENIDTLENVQISMSGARKITALAFDATGTPHAVYSDLDHIVYAIRNGEERRPWSRRTIVNKPGGLGQLVELVLDADGLPHITYYEVVSFSPLNGIIMYGNGAVRE